MPHDRRTRRSLSMFPGKLLLVITTVTLALGCQRFSLSRMSEAGLPPLPSSAPTLSSAPVPSATTAAVPTPTPAPGALVPAPKAVAILPSNSGPLNPTPIQPASQNIAPAPTPVSPASGPDTATPILDESLRRAHTASLAAPDHPRFTAGAASELPAEPQPFPNVFLNGPFPPIPPLAPDPKIDLKVELTTALVPDRPAVPIAPADLVQPHDLWRESLDRLKSVAHDRAGETGNESHDLWRVRAQLIDSLADPESASTPENEATRRTVLAALAALDAPEVKSGEARGLSAKIRAAVENLEDRTPLEITELQLCRKVKRFGDFEPLEPAACRAGHAVILYCEMAGVRYAPEGNMQRSRLASRVEIVAPDGGEPVWTHTLGTADDLCRHHRRDFYVNYRMTLPDRLTPGPYELRLIQDDLVAGRSTTAVMPLVIAP